MKGQKTENAEVQLQRTGGTEIEVTSEVTSQVMQEKWKVAAKLVLLTGMGIAGRVALQYVPSVEPLTAMAIVFAFFLGPMYGVIPGALGFFVSNFLVWGGQGPWTVFQMVGVGVAALIAGLIGKANQGRTSLVIATFLGVAAYEFIVDLSWGFFAGFGLGMFLPALPFSFVHLATTLGFALIAYEAKDKILNYLEGEIHEIKILVSRYAPNRAGYIRKLVDFTELRIRKHYNDKRIEYKKWGIGERGKECNGQTRLHKP